MIINSKGKVAENFYVLGASEMPIYLLDGEKPVLFEASLSILGRSWSMKSVVFWETGRRKYFS